MKLSIKTLKGDLFTIDCESTDTIAVIKEKISLTQPDFPVPRQKLIFSGKVLVDESTIGETGASERDFLVIMATKEKVVKPTSSPLVAAAAPAPSPLAQPQIQAISQPLAPLAQTSVSSVQSPEIRQIVDMGFPENEARAALLASNGNPGVAIEFLMSGMPIPAPPVAAQETTSELDQLRHHPQINHLRSLLQQNPEAIGQVLEAIGQQNPELLRLINAHQEDFLALMNEPIDENDEGENDEDQYDGFAHPLLPLLISSRTDDEGDHDLAELLHMFPTLSEEEQQAAAQGLGMPLEQVQQLAQMLGTLPPDQIQQMLGAHFGGGEADGDEQPGGHVVALTQEEMNSVNRLMELGFSQQDAAAAFLACDRNEALAANLLLEGWSAEDIAHY